MKTTIHPQYDVTEVTCSCGNQFTTKSTEPGQAAVQSCSKCHPAYTGRERVVSAQGRVAQFYDRYGKRNKD